MTNSNYNRNRHHRTDNNGQRKSSVHGGELRNGRLSQFKNHNPSGQDIPNEYVSRVDEEDYIEEEFVEDYPPF